MVCLHVSIVVTPCKLERSLRLERGHRRRRLGDRRRDRRCRVLGYISRCWYPAGRPSEEEWLHCDDFKPTFLTKLSCLQLQALIGVGSVAPGIIGGTIADVKWKLDPTNNKERRVRHEAAHMLCGYMCGLPLAGYATDPAPQCEFFDRRDGNYADGEVYKKKRPFTDEEVERIAVTAMSGLMGELVYYDKADGGTGDLETLQEVFLRSDSEKLKKPQAREDMTRWGAYTSKNMLADYAPVYEKLMAAMDRGASVEECIATIEAA